MAKIDVSSIENYQNLSAEEKVAILEGYELPDAPTDNGEMLKLKNALNKASSEAAGYKRQLQEKMTEAERQEAERKEQEERMQSELTALKKEKTIAGYKSSYLSMGYAEDLANATALALADGDMQTVLNNQKAFLDAQKKALQADFVSSQPPLSKGNALSSKQIEDEQDKKLRMYMGV